MEALEQEKKVLTQSLEAARFRECTTLEEISSMLSWAQLVEEKANAEEVALEGSREELTNSHLCLTGLEKIIKELEEKITQDETEPPEWKKAWPQEREATLWDSPKLNKQLGERIFTFLQLNFDDCIAQFRAIGFPSPKETPAFLNISKTPKKVPSDLFAFKPVWGLYYLVWVDDPKK